MFHARRTYRVLPLFVAIFTAAALAACDNPAEPAAPLTLIDRVASDGDDPEDCDRGFIIVQGVVQCNP